MYNSIIKCECPDVCTFYLDMNKMYARKVGDNNPSLMNKTCIMAQLKLLKDKLAGNRVIVFVHKAQVNPTKLSDRSVV